MLNFWVCAVFSCIASSAIAGERADIIVAKDGSGNFTTIQAAIDAVQKNDDALKIIVSKNGIYVEKLMIKTNFIALVGETRRFNFFSFGYCPRWAIAEKAKACTQRRSAAKKNVYHFATIILRHKN